MLSATGSIRNSVGSVRARTVDMPTLCLTFGPESYRDIPFLGDDPVERARVGKETGELSWDRHVDALVGEASPVCLPQGEPATHPGRLARSGQVGCGFPIRDWLPVRLD